MTASAFLNLAHTKKPKENGQNKSITETVPLMAMLCDVYALAAKSNRVTLEAL